MADTNPADDGTSLTFTTSAAPEPRTAGPANIKGDYLEVHHPAFHAPPPPPTASSKKRKKSVAFAKDSPATNASPTTNTSTPRKKRRSSKKTGPGRIIPTTMDECSEADKLLLSLRDAGHTWRDIRTQWTALTGDATAASTLPNRYNRLKTHLTHLFAKDNPLLLLAKRQVEASFEAQKWELVASVVREKGGEVYPGKVLQKQWRRLMGQRGVEGPPEGVRDADWE
ncbi:hypothetical protein PRZ48_004053 [Zasmidium cellare]|uniref:Myb-like domain-containing protein n=1 Tax=Zasmidium cellare TaxID=395010 RepID=A0ABR0EY13_ZASCE|nr:hypothetical protein PRZ48_004053 [Zasmidium cellare]